MFANPISSVSCSILGPQLVESGMDSGVDSGVDSGMDSGVDSGADSGMDSEETWGMQTLQFSQSVVRFQEY